MDINNYGGSKMKELSIEDKAKRYDEALERARKLCAYPTTKPFISDLQDLFPELRESGDERMWKLLKKYVHYNISDTVLEADHITREYLESWLEKQVKQSSNILWHDVSEEPDEKREIFCEWKSSTGIWHSVVFYYADSKAFFEGEGMVQNVVKWTYVNEMLEKQGEQKSVDKVEPKFKVGDWVVWQDKCYKVNYNGCGYELVDKNGLSTSLEYGTIDENAHLWTIEDAKEGDILVIESGRPFIFKGCLDERHPNSPVAYCGIDCGNDFHISVNISWWTDGNVFPATKEQCDFLFQKMKDAGYEWNEDKKELIKL